jgi:WD40 repeat protein
MRNPGTSLYTFSSQHTAQINKVEFNPKNPCLFAACSDDNTVSIWDISKIGAEISQEEL